ncbi:MAG TPA: TonB family protein [Terriglobales bacterium]
MSYKSLLFCPDEKAARLVTQVLSELDFTVEVASETFATVRKLGDEHFDALVVDCQDEQNATLLFKAAKNSAENHSSLSVAVVEGQAGVAKAFRIGANLVLTKPINVEQSKSTLRVARGLLKKNQAKPAGASTAITTAPAVLAATADSLIPSTPQLGVPAASSSSPSSMMSSQVSAHSESFSVLQVEKESAPNTEAADAAVLESLPELKKNATAAVSPSPSSMPASLIGGVGQSGPNFAGFSGGGAAAATAPALEKKPVELPIAGSAPQFTNEPIIKDAGAPETFEIPSATPTFSSLESQAGSEGGGKGFLKIAAIFLVVAVGGFFGWQKLQTMHRSSASVADSPEQTSTTEKTPATPQSSTTQAAPATLMPPPSTSDQTTKDASEEPMLNATQAKAQQNSDPDDIRVQEMPFSRDTKVTVTPKPQPLIVKAGTARAAAQPTAALAPPAVDVSGGNSSEAITNLVTSTAQLPKPAPGMVRISQGVSQGLLLKKVPPAYPRMALQLHKEGLVELLATVSKDGRISNIKVLSGDGMLTAAATEAVRQWLYRPYLLNGQPLEVETQITVSFKLPK